MCLTCSGGDGRLALSSQQETLALLVRTGSSRYLGCFLHILCLNHQLRVVHTNFNMNRSKCIQQIMLARERKYNSAILTQRQSIVLC